MAEVVFPVGGEEFSRQRFCPLLEMQGN